MFMRHEVSSNQSGIKTNGRIMDPRDVLLIRQYGYEQAQYFLKLAADPRLDLFNQIKHSDIVLRIRNRSQFRQKISIVNIETIS